MTLRTKSRGRQWLVWGGLSLIALAVAAVWSFLATGSVSVGYFCPQDNRLALPFFALFAYLGWEMRWDGIRRGKGKGRREQGEEKVKVEGRKKLKLGVEVEERNLTSGAAEPLTSGQETASPLTGQPVDAAACRVEKEETASDLTRQDAASTEKTDLLCPPLPHFSASPTQPSVEPATGEDLFAQARALPHQEIPDFDFDGPYLDLLGRSAAAGYAPALAKLGEYAMRRAAWVEAYYWMSMAKRQGMLGLANVMREIRNNWAQDDFPDQTSNVNRLFTLEAGSIGRALLHVDSGHEAAKAREFLKAIHPEFLSWRWGVGKETGEQGRMRQQVRPSVSLLK